MPAGLGANTSHRRLRRLQPILEVDVPPAGTSRRHRQPIAVKQLTCAMDLKSKEQLEKLRVSDNGKSNLKMQKLLKIINDNMSEEEKNPVRGEKNFCEDFTQRILNLGVKIARKVVKSAGDYKIIQDIVTEQLQMNNSNNKNYSNPDKELPLSIFHAIPRFRFIPQREQPMQRHSDGLPPHVHFTLLYRQLVCPLAAGRRGDTDQQEPAAGG